MRYEIQELAILLVGIKEPIPSPFHLQGELFILTETKVGAETKVENIDTDINAYQGAFIYDNKMKVALSDKGKAYFHQLYKEYSSIDPWAIGIMKLVREVFDKLSVQEFALLLYNAYPEISDISAISTDIPNPNSNPDHTMPNLPNPDISQTYLQNLTLTYLTYPTYLIYLTYLTLIYLD